MISAVSGATIQKDGAQRANYYITGRHVSAASDVWRHVPKGFIGKKMGSTGLIFPAAQPVEGAWLSAPPKLFNWRAG